MSKLNILPFSPYQEQYLQYCTLTIFQNEEPKAFDQHLPPITPDDVTMLRNEVPELAQDLQ